MHEIDYILRLSRIYSMDAWLAQYSQLNQCAVCVCVCVCVISHSVMFDSLLLWTIASQALSMGFSQQEYWSNFPLIYQINKRKDKSHMTISMDAENTLHKIQHPIMVKTLMMVDK